MKLSSSLIYFVGKKCSLGILACCGLILAQRVQSAESLSKPSLERLVFVGDSITVGVGISVNREIDRYSSTVIRYLKSKHPNLIEINLGASGQALCDRGEGAKQAVTVLQKNPDAIVIQWGVNDHFWGYSIAQFAARYDSFVRSLRQSKPSMPIVLATLVPDYRWPEYSEIWINEANLAIQEIAVTHSCHLAGVHWAFNHNRSLTGDEIHPNKTGAEVMAKAIAEAFDSAPLSPKNLRVEFDQGRENRFMQYVFSPKWDSTDVSRWIRISELSPERIQVETSVPLTIRTKPIYKTKQNYLITLHNCDKVEKNIVTVDWTRMITLTLKPDGINRKFNVEITPDPDSNGSANKK